MRETDPGYVGRTRAFYAESFARHGLDHRGLGYRSRASQMRRIEVLAEVGDLDGRRILDVGAGLGDLLIHLWSRGVVPDYTGLDLCGHLTAAAKARVAGEQLGPCRFVTGDIVEYEDPAGYDYVLASGVFGLTTGETAARVGPSLQRMFSLCRVAVAVNFLSAWAVRHAEQRLYLQPEEVLGQALRLSRAATLRHDYLPNDFTLYLFRGPPWASRRR